MHRSTGLPGHLSLATYASYPQANITRSKDEAISILESYASQIHGSSSPSKTFGDLAKVHSDCASHDQNGDLGWFGRGQMQKPFEDATYALEKGQISDVVLSDSGVHLIMRTG